MSTLIEVLSTQGHMGLRASPCHRLDVGTGGLLLVAKTPQVVLVVVALGGGVLVVCVLCEGACGVGIGMSGGGGRMRAAKPKSKPKPKQAAAGLCEQLKQRRVVKKYSAVVVGQVSHALDIDVPLHGQEARTLCKPLQTAESRTFGHLTLVELSPLTGRRHQLRKHMAGKGLPILGDKKYRSLSHAASCQTKHVRGPSLFPTLRHPTPQTPPWTLRPQTVKGNG